jgi:hypothetical protein
MECAQKLLWLPALLINTCIILNTKLGVLLSALLDTIKLQRNLVNNVIRVAGRAKMGEY